MLVLLNRSAGTLVGAPINEIARRVEAGLREHGGVAADVRIVDGADMAREARAAAAGPHDTVVAGGGDGTITSVVEALLGSGKTLGVLPLGTHNHFAHHLGLPTDLDAAVAALATATARPLDVAEVNGHPFLNFTGLGLHPLVVREREALHEPRRRNKFVSFTLAFLRALRRMPLVRVGIGAPGTNVRWRLTPSVIVCVNPHQMRLFGVENAAYTEAETALHLYVARGRRWIAIAWLAVLAVLRRIDVARSFEVSSLDTLDLHVPRRRVAVTIDGEIRSLVSPLRYRIRRGALQVLAPAEPAAASEPPANGGSTTA